MSAGPIRERLSSLSRGEMVGLAAVLVVTLGGAGLWYARSLPKPVEVLAGPEGSGPAPVEADPTAEDSPQTLFVDVAGWVRRPGVYEFATGGRVIDAIEAAGGPRRGAFLQSLNLAAPLTDGTQILVPKEGEVATAPAPGSGTGVAGGLVNVNLASAAELETLPGVGEVIAQRIIDHRTANGPFASVDRLTDVSGIGDATLESIRELVTV